MDLTKEQQRRNEFCNILFELATNQEMLQDKHTRATMYRRLEALYYSPNKEDGFRHFYSDVFTVLTQIQQDPQRGDINILGQNLSLIRAGYNPQNQGENKMLIDISDNIQKLYDHVNLDIARILYSNAENIRTLGEDTISETQLQIKQIKSDIKEIELVQNDVKKELGKQQKEYIAILGIFAAVVLTFTGGIAFSTSVLNNINGANPYRIAIIALVIGLILLNVLFGLFYYVDRLVNGQDRKSIKPLWISNIAVLILLIISIICWMCGIIEYRNRRINIPYTEQVQTKSPAPEVKSKQQTPIGKTET